MAAPATALDFIEVARKSQQIDNARLEAYLRDRRVDSLPGEPRKLAGQLVRDGLMTLFQAEQFLLGKYKGFALGGYRIVERLGTGGTGTVYLGEHQVLCRRAALKVLPAPFADEPAILERFRREAQAAAVLDHPNVVHIYDFRQEGPLYFIVMEYIEGANLQQLVNRRGALPIGEACEYIRQAAIGLQHAHEQGMVHRDVKPANLVVDASGTVKVLDLGLARFEPTGEASITRQFNSGIVLGTADYLAPEQALNLHEVDARADVYSLGATLYVLLAGHPPFHGGTIGQKLMWHQMKAPEPVNVLRADVPAELAAVVTRMLAKQPEDRVATMADVTAALEQWAVPPPAGPERIGSRSPTQLARVSRTGPLANSRRLAPQAPAEDTLVARRSDTSPMESLSDSVPINQQPPKQKAQRVEDRRWRVMLFLFGFGATAVWLLASLLALLVWLL
jgi:eukaryotic-like serine/threonine-protein kinase